MGHWQRLTVIGALARDGTGCSPAEHRRCHQHGLFIEQVPTPALRDCPDAMLVMDDLAAHKAEAAENGPGPGRRRANPGATPHARGAACALRRHDETLGQQHRQVLQVAIQNNAPIFHEAKGVAYGTVHETQ
jgi:hypothetical protein